MKINRYISVIMLFAGLTVQAQDKNIDTGLIIDFNDMSNVEDSDGVIKSDYYSLVSFVRSGSETYSVKTGSSYHSDLVYAGISNTSNKYTGKHAYIKETGQTVPSDRIGLYAPNDSQMKEIIKKVFPNCIFGINPDREMNNQQSLLIQMLVDPNTQKVLEIYFAIDSDKPGIKAQKTLFSLPPSKLRQLEELINGKVDVETRGERKYLSYTRAVYRIYFKKFEL